MIQFHISKYILEIPQFLLFLQILTLNSYESQKVQKKIRNKLRNASPNFIILYHDLQVSLSSSVKTINPTCPSQ